VNANDGALSKRAVRAAVEFGNQMGTILSGDRGALRSHTELVMIFTGVARKYRGAACREAARRGSKGKMVRRPLRGYKHACEPPSTDKSDSVAPRANADDGALAEFVAA